MFIVGFTAAYLLGSGHGYRNGQRDYLFYITGNSKLKHTIIVPKYDGYKFVITSERKPLDPEPPMAMGG